MHNFIKGFPMHKAPNKWGLEMEDTHSLTAANGRPFTKYEPLTYRLSNTFS